MTWYCITLLVAASLMTVFADTANAQTAMSSAGELARRAIQANRELTAARLDLERGRARLRQAGLRPNPTIDVQRTTGRFTGSPEEQDFSLGFALPVELARRRQRRIELAEAELAATEAELGNRERQLVRDVLVAYAEALAAARERQITVEMRDLDQQTTGFVRTRVQEGDAPNLELSLLLTEVDRLRSHLALVEGRLQAALITLNTLTGGEASTPLVVADQLTAAADDPLPMPATVQDAIDLAIRQRPDLRKARLSEQAAEAQLRLARAEGSPELTLSTTYSSSASANALPPPLSPVTDHQRVLAFGASIGLPLFNANQGARAEAEVAIRQAQLQRQFVEQTVRAEVTSAFRRAEAAREAIRIFDQGVIDRSLDNVRVMRASYELGEFRITDVIAEQRRLLESQREYADAVLERYRAAVDLLAATGTSVTPQP